MRLIIDDNAISIHALVKRATGGSLLMSYGVDISIHALVKRATSKIFYFQTNLHYFNPRPRKEGDLDQSGVLHPMRGFQSTPS